MDTKEIQKLEATLSKGKHITFDRLCKLAKECKWKHAFYVVRKSVFKPEFQALEERAYVIDRNNKAFISGMLGYSIFGQSIAMLKRGIPTVDRAERYPTEYCIAID